MSSILHATILRQNRDVLRGTVGLRELRGHGSGMVHPPAAAGQGGIAGSLRAAGHSLQGCCRAISHSGE